MFPKSIRWRLILWLGFLLVGVLGGFGVTVSKLRRIDQFNQVDEELQHRITALSSAVRKPPMPGRMPFNPGLLPPDFYNWELSSERRDFGKSPEAKEWGGSPFSPHEFFDPPRMEGFRRMRLGPPREIQLSGDVSKLFDESLTNGYYFSVWSREGSSLKRSTNAPATIAIPPRLDAGSGIHTRTIGDSAREAYYFTEFGDCILVGRSIVADLKALNRFNWWLMVAGGTILAFGLGGGWWLTTSAIRPVEEISSAASRISAGNLAERINVSDTASELGRLAGVLNSTFARLESAFSRQRQFTADASHELRTPLAVIISEAQTTLARERKPAEYRETIEACLETAQQMRRLTESLLELSRVDAGQEQIQRRPVDLAEIARNCAERIRPMARERGIEIHCQLSSAPAMADPDRMNQVFTNLLTNAIHYNKPSGQIRIDTGIDHTTSFFTIADTGLGIGPEDLPHIFERFYRADKSRSNPEGRSGLGLAICKAIVDAHGGEIGVESEIGVGTVFRVGVRRDA